MRQKSIPYRAFFSSLLGAERANSGDDFRSVMAWVALVLPSDVLVLDVASAGSVQAIDWVVLP